jgi:hypothetical protein
MARIALSWTCYWLGDLAYRLDWGETYQRLMNWAFKLQGSDPRGPWDPADETEGT